MRQYLLDTGPLAVLLLRRSAAEALMQPWLVEHVAATSMLVYGELVEYLAGRPDSIALNRALLDLVGEVYPFLPTFPVIDRCAHVRRQMRPPHGAGLIGDIDTVIAATALVNDLTIVTTDSDFIRVPDLRVMLRARRTFAPLNEPAS